MVGFDLVAGRATQTGTDSDGNPVYTVAAHSVFNPQEAVTLDDITPDRWYEGVVVTQPNAQAKCIGVKSSLDEWTWIVFNERIDWGDCEP